MHFSDDRVWKNGGESMKKSIWSLIVAALTLGVCAAPVSLDDAKIAATAWAMKNAAFGASGGATDVVSVTDPTNSNVVLWHQVSMENGGMLIVAPVTEIEPVVVALDNNPGELPPTLRGILTGDMRRRLQFLGLYTTGASLASVAPTARADADVATAWGEANRAKWARLTGGGASLMAAVGLTEITVDICTVRGFGDGENGYLRHWNQGGYNGAYLYNLYTPGNAVCGCVATVCGALAQFYGTTNALDFSNTCSYNGTTGSYKTRVGPIDWNILPSNWGGTNAAIMATEKLTTEQQELLGGVAYNAGVGVGMMWTAGESGAFTTEIVTALKKVFGFRHARAVRFEDAENPDQQQMEKLIYNQVRAGVPVGLSIEGHAVVAAGYGLDADNVERVRVFMGWGGAGDGWYALPKIDTKATMNGGSYLSEVVDEVITMIAYDDDNIVPVVGHVSMPGSTLEVPALKQVIESNEYGYFGTRVPAALPVEDCIVTCMGRKATFEIGEAAAESEEGAELVEALPGAFEFSLLNCTVAYSLERAKLLAEKEGKAILRVSGMSVDTNTAVVLDYVYSLDKDNVNNFTNRFVYVFSSSDSLAGDGAGVSYGVYLPSALDPGDRWLINNGALSYGYLSTVVIETNNTHNADHVQVEGMVTNVTVSTFAPAGVNYAATTNAVGELDVIHANLLQSVADVINVGAERFAENMSGITVTVTATPEDVVTAMGEHDGSYPNGVYDKCGSYKDCFMAGANVTFTCNAEITNETQGVVFGCAGWSITNATTGATLEGKGSEATFEVASNDVVTLTWDLSKVVAVKMTVIWEEDHGALKDAEAVTPGTGWYPAGTPVMFEAKPEVGTWKLEYIKSTVNPEGTIDLSPLKVLVPMDAPGTVEASYRKGSTLLVEPEAPTITCAVTVSNYVWDAMNEVWVLTTDRRVPNTVVYTQEGQVQIANGATENVPGAEVAGMAVAKIRYVTAEGVVMEFRGLKDDPDDDGVSLIERNFSESDIALFEWGWEPVGFADVTEEAPEAFTIAWNEDLDSGALSGLQAGFTTNLLTAAQAEQFGMTVADVAKMLTVPKGFTATVAEDADGNIVATLELDEDVLQPVGLDGASSPLTIVSNADGTVTVKADVANGVRGFWYTLYGSDNLADWEPVKTGYVDGKPSDQAKVDDDTVSVWIKVEPNEAKRFFKLVVTDHNP